jgi:hypothetical protein
MQTPEFDKIVQSRIGKIGKILSNKAKEYASWVDRLHNFKVAARITGETPEMALRGMLMKHIVSVFDIIEHCRTLTIRQIIIDEKLGDSINYLILLEALLYERYGYEAESCDEGEVK